MEQERLFRTKWSAKSLLILAMGLIFFGVVVLVAYQVYKVATRNRQVQNVVNVDSAAVIESEWTLGNFERINGTDYVMAAAHSKQSYQGSYYEKDASAVRNYLFVNAFDKSSRWLVPTNKYLFLTAEKLRLEAKPGAKSHEQVEGYNSQAIRWIKYELVKSDTNNDGRFTTKDRRTIAVSDASGENYTEVIENIEQILGSMLNDEDTLLIFYSTGAGSYVSEINLPKRQVTTTKELPKIQPE